MENRNRLHDFPRCSSFFIDNPPSSECVCYTLLSFSFLPSPTTTFGHDEASGLIASARSLFGGHRSTFGFVVLPFVRVVLFPSPAICWSCVVP